MNSNDKPKTAEDILAMALQMQTIEDVLKGRSQELKKTPCLICDMPTTQELCEKCYLEAK